MVICPVQRLVVALLLLCFAAVLPTHAHATDVPSGEQTPGSHQDAKHDCPVCRIAGGMSLPGPGSATPVEAPTLLAITGIANAQALPALPALPFHGRAPPIL